MDPKTGFESYAFRGKSDLPQRVGNLQHQNSSYEMTLRDHGIKPGKADVTTRHDQKSTKRLQDEQDLVLGPTTVEERV